MQSSQPLRAGILAVLLPVVAFAESPLQKVWEVRLTEKLIEPAGWITATSHPIIELAFSPDGKKFAATMDDHYQHEVHNTHLWIVDVQNPQASFRQFDLGTCGRSLAWAPDGNALLVCGRVVRLEDGRSCQSGDRSHWLTADRVIRAGRTVTDLFCQSVEKWAIAGNWQVAGTVPAKGWMLLAQSMNGTANGRTFKYNHYAVADRDSHKLTASTLFSGAYRDASTIMAQAASMVCSELTPAGGYKSVLRCWSLPGGEVVPFVHDLTDYRVTQAALSSPRVVAEHWGYHLWNRLSEVPEMLTLSVLDLHSGRKIASFKPRQQRDYPSGGIWNRYFQYALSSGGDFLIEGGDGAVSLYHLQ